MPIAGLQHMMQHSSVTCALQGVLPSRLSRGARTQLVWSRAVCEDRREFVLLPSEQASKSYASCYYEHVSIICAYRRRQRPQR
jgi:hypothetical protein